MFPMSSVTHLQSFGLFLQMANFMHYGSVLQVVSQRANLFFSGGWVLQSLLYPIHKCGDDLTFEWGCPLSSWETHPLA